MTAKCSAELGRVNQVPGGATHGGGLAQEELAVSSSPATTTLVVTTTHMTDGNGTLVWRITTDDTAVYVARGPVPDPTATTPKPTVTSMRRMVAAGASLEMPAHLGDKIAVKAV